MTMSGPIRSPLGTERAPRRRRTALVGLMCLGLWVVAAGCQQCQTAVGVRVGNLDRPGDIVLITGNDGHTYGVVSNPDLGHVRVVDFTAERFLDAPNRFFPLSVPVGIAVSRLAVAAGDDSRIYALDAASDAVVVVRALEGGEPSFVPMAQAIETARAPGSLAAVLDASGSTELWITLPEQGAVQVLQLEEDGASATELARLTLPEGSRPTAIVADPLGESVVVADSALPHLYVFSRASHVLDRSMDVGGPSSALAAGVVDVGDGLAPVVLALRSDVQAVTALRLYRPGVREDRYALLGTAPVPSLPLVAYVPDQRTDATVCCRALSSDAVAAGEATAAWAAVGLADGRFVYVALAAPTSGGGRSVRVIDNDPANIALRAVDTEVWLPAPGDEGRRPVATLVPRAEGSDVQRFVETDETLTLTWEGGLPAMTDLAATLDGAAIRMGVNASQRGARVGDIAVLHAVGEPSDCVAVHDAPIVAVDGASVVVTRSADGLTDEDVRCLLAGTDLRLTVAAADAFVVQGSSGDMWGRLRLDDESGGGSEAMETVLALPGADLIVAPASGGPPVARGSVLLVPLDPHVELVALDLSAPALRVGAGGGLGQGGYLPAAIVGRAMDIPDPAGTGTLRARRMVLVTGSADGAGGHVLLACDDAESTVALCDLFQ